MDRHGSNPPVTNQPELEIPSLPASGTQVTVEVTITNFYLIHSSASFTFTTTQELPSFQRALREMQCRLRQIKAINAHILPWEPAEEGGILPAPEQLITIEQQAEQMSFVARRLVHLSRP